MGLEVRVYGIELSSRVLLGVVVFYVGGIFREVIVDKEGKGEEREEEIYFYEESI